MKFKISGHEKFSLRYPWLPKAVDTIKKDPGLFSHDDDAMVEMGVGKNMVRSIRFWTVACEVACKKGKETTRGMGKALSRKTWK